MLDEENKILYIDNKRIHLGPLECKLLSLLIENKHTCLSSKYLTKKLFLNYVSDTNIYALINRTNKRIYPYIKIINKPVIGYKIKVLQNF